MVKFSFLGGGAATGAATGLLKGGGIALRPVVAGWLTGALTGAGFATATGSALVGAIGWGFAAATGAAIGVDLLGFCPENSRVASVPQAGSPDDAEAREGAPREARGGGSTALARLFDAAGFEGCCTAGARSTAAMCPTLARAVLCLAARPCRF